MSVTLQVRISSRTLALLAAAARETKEPVERFATLAVRAALRLYDRNPATTAVPRFATRETIGADVEITITDKQHEAVVAILYERGMTMGVLLRAILDAAVQDYDAPPPPPPPATVKPRAPAMAAKRFDPAFYAKRAAAFMVEPEPKTDEEKKS